jgi:putative copper export protein
MALLILWLHVAGMAVWVGGLAHQSLATLPGGRPDGIEGLLEGARRARPVAWTALALVVLTGFYNVTQLGPVEQVMAGGAALVLAGKFILVLAAIALAGQRDFAWLPRLRRAHAAGADPRPALGAIAWLDRTTLALAAIIIYLGLTLSRS